MAGEDASLSCKRKEPVCEKHENEKKNERGTPESIWNERTTKVSAVHIAGLHRSGNMEDVVARSTEQDNFQKPITKQFQKYRFVQKSTPRLKIPDVLCVP